MYRLFISKLEKVLSDQVIIVTLIMQKTMKMVIANDRLLIFLIFLIQLYDKLKIPLGEFRAVKNLRFSH